MANSIALAKAYVPLLDRVYKEASKTSVLDIAPALVKAGNKAGSFLLPSLTLVGLGDYSRTAGYSVGDVGFSWDEYTYTQDRGRTFSVDEVDDVEAASACFGNIAGEFLRLHVVPEVDAYRMATISTDAGQGDTGTLGSTSAWIAAVNAAKCALEDAEVATENMVLFIASSGRQAITTAPNTENKCPVLTEATVVTVPSGRFNTAITTDPGSTASAGGFTATGDAINFILMDKGAAFTDAKHTAPRIFDPMTNQDANAWRFDYRLYHDCFVYENKVNGIYAHTTASES